MPRPATAICLSTHRRQPDQPRQAADGLNLCQGCLDGLRRHLDDLPALYDDVIDQLDTGGTGTGTAVSGTPGIRLPYNPAASDVASQIRYDLQWHVTLVANGRGLTPPPAAVTAMCAWLARHVDWLAARPEAGQVRDVFLELAGRAWAVIDPDRRPIHIGPCTQVLDDGQPCDGQLHATVRRDDDPTPSEIFCDVCGLRISSTGWRRFGRTYTRTRERMTT